MRVRKLYSVFQDYMRTRVIGNEVMFPLAYHVVLGQLIRVSYNSNGEKTARLHGFLISPSRTGKGELMKACVDLLNFFQKHHEKETIEKESIVNPNIMNEKAIWSEEFKKRVYRFDSEYVTSEVTAQMLRGETEKEKIKVAYDVKNEEPKKEEKKSDKKQTYLEYRKKNVSLTINKIKPGILGRYALIAIAEGKDIIDPSNAFAGNDLRSVILNATDDPGYIRFGARCDLDENQKMQGYMSSSSILAGTVKTESISRDILELGFLNRFLFIHYEPSSMIDLIEKVIMFRTSRSDIYLKQSDFKDDFYLEQEKEEFKKRQELGELEEGESYPKSYIPHVEFNSPILEILVKKIRELREELGIEGLSYDRKKLADAYLMAGNEFMKKIAAQSASLDGSFEVREVDIEYAYEVIKPVVTSYFNFTGRFFKSSNSEDDKRKLQIRRAINMKGTVSWKELYEIVSGWKTVGDWPLTRQETKKLVDEQIEEKRIIEEKDPIKKGNTKKLKLADGFELDPEKVNGEEKSI